MKSQMKGVLRAEKNVNWNTAFVDISARLISVITDYRDNQRKNPYKHIANKLANLKNDREKTIKKQVVRPIKVTDTLSSELVAQTQNGNFCLIIQMMCWRK